MPVNDIPHCAEGVHRAAARKFSSHGEDDTSPHASTSTSNAMWSSSTSARHVTFERKCQLHVLSPTTEMDVGAADYNTAYSHLLSLEYLFSVGIFAYLHIHGFVLLRRLCEVHNSSFSVLISTPKTIMEYLGSSGYDHNLDVQFYAYCDALWILALLSAALGIATYVCHRLATLSSRTADDSPASSAACSEAFSLSPLVQPIGANTSSSSSTSKSRRTPPKTPVDVALTISRQTSRVKASAACLPPLIYSVVGVIFIAVVHGPHFFLPLLLIAANYVVFTRLQRWCPYWAFMAIMWVVHTGLLYIIELYSGFEETYWLQYLFPTSFESTFNVLGPDFTREGLWRQQMRWCVAFRMTTLRLIAFNYDLWEATHSAARARERATGKHDATCIECAQLREQNSRTATALRTEASRCYKYRTEYPRDLSDYNFVNYLAYIVFPPLYLAGPMSSFNAFVSYMRVPSASTTFRCMSLYLLRTICLYIVLMLLLHFVFIYALSTLTIAILNMDSSEQAYFFLYSLMYIWLKFSFIWKSSRLFAMFSGIEVPEDIKRCYANTLTIGEFWRDWHASFNLWIVRYMYIPMGGSRTKLFSVFPVFLFIALWHDPALHLLKWALCIAVMFVLEMAVSGCFGWVTNVFRREMAARAACNRGDGDNAGVGVEEVGVTHSPQSSGQCGGVPAVLLRPAARFAARRMSPRARSWSYRMLRVLAGMFSVFGLILANLIGFSMQNSSANVEKTDYTASIADADNAIIRSLQNPSVCFVVGLVMAMYAFASVGAIERDLTYHHTKMLKARFGLK